MTGKPRHVRKPVQAYLDQPDAQLLAELAQRTSTSKAEVIRQAIRRMAQDMDLASRPGAGLSALLGSLDHAGDAPNDLAARHDDYLYGDPDPKARRR